MEHSVRIRMATLAHVSEMAPNVRECDRREIWAQSHMEPGPALAESVFRLTSESPHPVESHACLLDGEVVAMFGIVDVSETAGVKTAILWMIGTDKIYDNADLFHEHTAQWLAYYRSRFEHIYNWVDSRNTAAVKWIESVGFEVRVPAPYGPDGVPFHYFEWRRG